MKNSAKRHKKRIFLDYASITPVDSRVEEVMRKIQKNFWANPSSLHTEGEKAKNVLEEARLKIARILHCKGSEIFFTSGGTESLNIAISGVVKSQRASFGTGAVQRRPLAFLPHIIVSSIEHPAVLEPIKSLLKNGEAEVSFISADENGIINPESIKKELKENTVLVIIQHANNEIGTIQPIAKISKIIKEFRKSNENKTPPQPLPQGEGQRSGAGFPYLLVDAVQSVLYEDVSLERLGADILVLDGIKMYGPRGAGILAVKHGVNIFPITFGGGQEKSIRPGTENVVAATGLAKALEIASEMREKESKRLTILRNYAIEKILKPARLASESIAGGEIPVASLNGGSENRLPNNINICFATPKLSAKAGLSSIDSEFLVIKLDFLGFAVSAASACHTISLENSSYVIESLGKPECASSSLRFTLGRDTKKSDLDSLISALKKIIK